jgi:hypothetical protein
VWKNIYRPGAKAGHFLYALALSGIGYGLYRGIQDNYLAEVFRISRFERGLVEFCREVPGLLVILILAGMYRFSESRIFKIGSAVMLAGLLGLFSGAAGPWLSAKVQMILFMVIYSAGEHIVMPVKSTIPLELARQGQGGASLGLSGALSHLGHITGYAMVTVLFFIFARTGFGGTPRFKAVFAAAAVLTGAAAAVALGMGETKGKKPRRRFYFHRKFSKYYMLEIFYGARKQIFLTFAPYVLILHYGADTSIISLLMGICALCGFAVSPFLGKLIDRAGYKAVMVGDTLLLVLVCLFYGFAHRIFPPAAAYTVVCVNYVLDSIISLASMASNVYVKDLAESQEELTATVSTGISVNHLISILIALSGGWLWEKTGIEVLFSLSALLGIVNSLYAATIKVKGGKRHENSDPRRLCP